jgi:hypothetical protein
VEEIPTAIHFKKGNMYMIARETYMGKIPRILAVKIYKTHLFIGAWFFEYCQACLTSMCLFVFNFVLLCVDTQQVWI